MKNELGSYKIGISKDPEGRSRNLTTQGSVPVELLVTYDTGHYPARLLEKELHEHFKERRTIGEWFTGLTTEDINFIKGFVDNYESGSEVTLPKNDLPRVRMGSFTMQSDQWLFDSRITDGEKIKLMKLYWKYDFYRSLSYKEIEKGGVKKKATRYMYCTQKSYADFLGIPRNKVSSLFNRFEDLGLIVRIKSGKVIEVEGENLNIPADYLVVLNPSHRDYYQDLNDVWVVLSLRLNTFELNGDTEKYTYKRMKSSYEVLFKDKERHTPPHKEK